MCRELRRRGQGTPVLTLTARDAVDGQVVGLVLVAQSLGAMQDSLNRLLAGSKLPAVAAARALAPIDHITQTARRISAEDLSARLKLPATDDEVGRLAGTLDNMLARLDDSFQRERQFTADTAGLHRPRRAPPASAGAAAYGGAGGEGAPPGPRRCQVANSSAWALRGRWRTRPKSCWPTSQLLKTNGQASVIDGVSSALAAQFHNVLPVRVVSTETVIKTEESSLTSLNLGGLGAMEQLYTLLVTSLGLAIFLLAMINERQREFGAMQALGANLSHLRRFLFALALTIGGLSLVIGAAVGIVLARVLVFLLAVIFTIPAQQLAWPGAELLTLAGLVIAGMLISTLSGARRLGTLKVVEALREE